MSYISEVVVRFTDNATKVVKKFYELDKQIKEVIDDSDNWGDFDHISCIHWNEIKWYEDTDEDVMAFMHMLDEIGEENYGMVRVGSEVDDVEYYGNTCDFQMYVNRSIEW